MEECDPVIVRGVGGRSRSRERWRREERDEGEGKCSKGKLERPGGPRKAEAWMLRDEERQTQRKTGHRERRKKYREAVSCKHTRVCTRTHTQAHPCILGISQCS